jgi:hypothetical protein
VREIDQLLEAYERRKHRTLGALDPYKAPKRATGFEIDDDAVEEIENAKRADALERERAAAEAEKRAAAEAAETERAERELEDKKREVEEKRAAAAKAAKEAEEARRKAPAKDASKPKNGNGSPWGKLPKNRLPQFELDGRRDLISIDKPRVTPDVAATRAVDVFVEKDLEDVPTLDEVIKEARDAKKLDVLTQTTTNLNREALDDVTRLLLSDKRVLAWAASQALKEGN